MHLSNQKGSDLIRYIFRCAARFTVNQGTVLRWLQNFKILQNSSNNTLKSLVLLLFFFTFKLFELLKTPMWCVLTHYHVEKDLQLWSPGTSHWIFTLFNLGGWKNSLFCSHNVHQIDPFHFKTDQIFLKSPRKNRFHDLTKGKQK